MDYVIVSARSGFHDEACPPCELFTNRRKFAYASTVAVSFHHVKDGIFSKSHSLSPSCVRIEKKFPNFRQEFVVCGSIHVRLIAPVPLSYKEKMKTLFGLFFVHH